jgi:hypothetical protein
MAWACVDVSNFGGIGISKWESPRLAAQQSKTNQPLGKIVNIDLVALFTEADTRHHHKNPVVVQFVDNAVTLSDGADAAVASQLAQQPLFFRFVDKAIDAFVDFALDALVANLIQHLRRFRSQTNAPLFGGR